ncbi:MAG: hypothetical protein IJG59_04785 [Erysipelotrichaceae bacterium]|nr:hypothetical protein [Erysipelotrichaceae bacterium]
MQILKKLLAALACFFLGSSIVLLNSVNVTDVFLQPQVVKSLVLDQEFSIATTEGEMTLTDTVKGQLKEKLQTVNVTDDQFEQLLKSRSVTNVYALIGEAVVAELRQVPSDIKNAEDVAVVCNRELGNIAAEITDLDEEQEELFRTEFTKIMQQVYDVLTGPSRRAIIPHTDIIRYFRGILIAVSVILILLMKVGLGKFSKACRTAGVIIGVVTVPFLFNVIRLTSAISNLGDTGSSVAFTVIKGLNYGPLMLRTRFTALTGVVLAIYGIRMARREYILEDGTIPIVLQDEKYFEEKNIL